MRNVRTQRSKKNGNGQGTIYECKTTGLLIGQYFVGGKRKSLYQRKRETRTEFKKRFTQVLNSVNEGTYIGKSTATIVTLAQEFIERKHNDKITSDRSYRRDLETLKQLKKTCSNFCDIPIQNVTITHLQDAKESISKYSNSIIDKIWRLLNKSFKMACSPSRKILNYNIMLDEELQKPISEKKTKKVMPLTVEENERFNYILDNEEREHKYRNIAKMQLISGMRIRRSIGSFY